MLKTRIIPTLLWEGYGLVKGARFDNWRRVGTALPAIKVYDRREVDELILVDIKASLEGRVADIAEVDRLADEAFMPLTVGGGVSSVEDVGALLRAGADKVSINSAAVERPALVDEAASAYGSQCIIVSIDVLRDGSDWVVFTHAGTRRHPGAVRDIVRSMANAGAGEILLTSIDRDGTMSGYDLELIREVARDLDIPLIASGGAGSYADMEAALGAGADAVAAASMFHFTEQTPLGAKEYLHAAGVPVRLPYDAQS